MRPDLVINFRAWSPPLLHFLLRKSGAPMRVQLSPGPAGYANVTLAAGDPPNHLRRFRLVSKLWESAGLSLSGKWSRIVPPLEAVAKAGDLLAAAGLEPARTSLLPWQDAPGRDQVRLVRALGARGPGAAPGFRVAVVQAMDALFPSPPPPVPELEGVPVLQADSASVLLALFAGTAGTVGVNGPLLLLAGLAEADVTGWFGPGDGPYDTSAGNARMKVRDLGSLWE
jgi:hypothetical protein